MSSTVSALFWRWDRQKCILWGDVKFADGHQFSVGLPLAHVVATFNAHASSLGIVIGDSMGDVDSVDGLFSSVKKLAKKATKAVSSAVKATTKTLAAGVKSAAAAAKTVARSSLVGTGLKVLSVAVPFVGVPALAAQQAAKTALDAVDRARSVARSGARTIQAAQAVAQGRNVVDAVQRLRNTNTPAARMALAALKQNLARK